MKSIFLDTNIILDILDTDRSNHVNASKVLEKVIFNGYIIVISEDMLSTIFYIVKNKQAVLDFFKLIIQEWRIVAFGEEVISTAIDFCSQNQGQDFEDTLQCLCAKQQACDFLVTHDNGFIDCGITVLTAQQFLAR